ncbi:Uncharacterised protein [Vibrio cholerae]|nr:Uncharacterised protein [Vibrio cholerae]
MSGIKHNTFHPLLIKYLNIFNFLCMDLMSVGQ